MRASMQKENRPLNTVVFQIQITVFQMAVLEFAPFSNDQHQISRSHAHWMKIHV